MDKSKQREMTFNKDFWIKFLPFIFAFVMILFFPILFTKFYWFKLDFTDTGEIGDTIGGIMGPFIAIAASILTFMAFWVQYKANEQQRKDIKLERFENKFYELLRLHKSNVDELILSNKIRGRESFVSFFYELRLIYKIVDNFIINDSESYQNINQMSFSYRIFFFGVGLYSEKYFKYDLGKEEKLLYEKVKPFLMKAQDDIKSHLDKNPEKPYLYNLKNDGTKSDYSFEFQYIPFSGHANILGHYYRHLFQTVNFIISQDLLDEDEKYSYIKTLRAQLSNFEQLNIYYNSIAWFKDEWKIIFTKYRFIKNIPIELADFDVKPLDYFEKEIKESKEPLFEWLE